MEKLQQICGILVSVALLNGCTAAKFSADYTATTAATEAVVSTSPTPAVTATVSPTPSSICSSAAAPIADLNIVSVAALSDYASKYLYAPTTVKLLVNLTDISSGRYAGSVQVSYYDQGVYHAGVFSSPAGTNVSISSLKDNGTLTSEYNRWYNSLTYFTGFFQDSYGAVVLSISGTDSNGCSSGSVYYRNFTSTLAPQSPYRKCWFIRDGPYECRASAVIDKTSLVPGDGYTLLGTFSGLPRAAAFK